MDQVGAGCPQLERRLQKRGRVTDGQGPTGRDQSRRREEVLVQARRRPGGAGHGRFARRRRRHDHPGLRDGQALSKNELSGTAAYMSGKLRVSGDLMKLMQLQGALGQMPAALKDLDVEY